MKSNEYFESKKSIQLIIQTTLNCNLRCKHCYESGVNYPNEVMSLTVLEKIIRLVQQSYERVDYLWFGGEPLMAGLDFFHGIVRFQEKHKNSCIINNSVQTNGVLVDEIWIDFFKENNFSISVSFDAQFNDELRQCTADTINAIDLCKSNGIKVTTISTITSKNCDYQYEMYEHLKDRGLLGKFNRIFAEGCAKKNKEYLIGNQKYVNSMKSFFDKWLYDNHAKKNSSIDICLRSLFDFGSKECIYNGCLFKWLAIAPNGDIYPCPRFVGSKMKLVNVTDIENINEAFYTSSYEVLLNDNLARIKKCQEECALFPYCHSGCNARSFWSGNLSVPSEDICSYVKEFFPYIVATLKGLVESEQITFANPYIQELYEKYKENFDKTFKYFEEKRLI